MLKLTKPDRDFIRQNFKDADRILKASVLSDVLDPIYDLIDEKGFAPPNYEDYNDFGRTAQKVYDRIYFNNKQIPDN